MTLKRKSKTYYSKDGVSITRRRARFGDDEIPIPDIDNVLVGNKASRNYSGCFWAVAGFCFIVAGASYGASLKAALSFLAVGFVAALVSFNVPGRKHIYTITVVADSGKRIKHRTTDRHQADRIIDALNNSILDVQDDVQSVD